jgi:gas vesicle protein
MNMGASRRLVRFGSGSLLGAALGSGLAILLAPESGEDLRRRLGDRVRQIRLAGVEAQAAKTDELVRKFRETINDPEALAETEAQARQRLALVAASHEMPRPSDTPAVS